jgi:hypothetical protein
MELTGIEPVTSGLQTQPITRPHLTRIDRIGMTEPKSTFLSHVIRHRSTTVRSHRARTAAAQIGNTVRASRMGDGDEHRTIGGACQCVCWSEIAGSAGV